MPIIAPAAVGDYNNPPIQLVRRSLSKGESVAESLAGGIWGHASRGVDGFDVSCARLDVCPRLESRDS
jgi:hypothetical protein